MYGDTTTIRALARDLRDRADDIRTAADRLAVLADRVDWHGLAADAMRRHAHDRCAALRRTAALHDDAADALDRHAREVERLKDLIASIEHTVHGLIDAARDRLVPDALDGLWRRFSPPLPGSRDWLGIDLPGI
jgi:Putative T7SS secretion signal domain